jgi:hypothetical protein
MSAVLKPGDLRKITDDLEMQKIKEYRAREAKEKQATKELREAFLSRDIHPDVATRLNNAIRHAAEQGLHELQVITFPSDYCNDGGRKINSFDPDWPQSLEGFAKKAYDYYEAELKKLGYKLQAQVLNYPNGMPGDVGMFLKW